MSNIDLMNDSHDFASLASTYGNFLVPAFSVKVGSKTIHGSAGGGKSGAIHLSGLRVDLSMEDMASCVTFDVINAYDSKNSRFDTDIINTLKLSEVVEVNLGYGSRLTKVFKGYISAISTSFSTGSLPTLQITCMDIIGLMMENDRDEQEEEDTKTYAEIISERLKTSPYTTYLNGSDIITDSTSAMEKAISQQSNDYHFITDLAREVGYEFFICQGKAYFRKPPQGKSPLITLKWGEGLISFSRELAARAYISSVKVVGKIQHTTQEVSYTAQRKSNDRTKPPGKGVQKIIKDISVESADEVQKRAEAEMRALEKRSVGGRCSCIGLPVLTPGRYVKLDGLSGELNGSYYITSVSHDIGGGGFTTNFDLGVAG